MASEPRLVKHPRYDLSMSRRTRKPKILAEVSPDYQDDHEPRKDCDDVVDDARRSSLKELMNESSGGGRGGGDQCDGGAESLALVRKQGSDGGGVVKMGRMVSKYVKVLSHLVKAKRDSKKKSAVPQLKP